MFKAIIDSVPIIVDGISGFFNIRKIHNLVKKCELTFGTLQTSLPRIRHMPE